jgi:hypothetical protein
VIEKLVIPIDTESNGRNLVFADMNYHGSIKLGIFLGRQLFKKGTSMELVRMNTDITCKSRLRLFLHCGNTHDRGKHIAGLMGRGREGLARIQCVSRNHHFLSFCLVTF